MIEFGTFRFDVSTCRLFRGDFEVHLMPKAAAVLCLLLRQPGELITKEEFLDNVWTDVHVREECLTQAISTIRHALGDSSKTPRFIETISGEGYRFVGKIRRSKELGDSPSPPISDSSEISTSLPLPRIRETNGGSNMIRSLAIRPLDFLSGDPRQAHFSDGMTDLLIAELGRISSLSVISPSTARHYKGTQKPAREITAELGVDALVDGSVLQADGQIRITVCLVDGPSGTQIWSQSYIRDLDDILSLQKEVTRSIVDEIEELLKPGEEGDSAGGSAESE